jgi:hypothetical protein
VTVPARRKRTSLDIAAQKVVVTDLAPLADRSWALVDAMRHAGWEAVLPRIGFEESFGQEEEVQEYRRFVIEVAKVWLASPNFHFRLPEWGPYISPYLEELRTRRDEENCKHFNPSDIPIWAKELATCLRRMELLRYAQRSEFER